MFHCFSKGFETRRRKILAAQEGKFGCRRTEFDQCCLIRTSGLAKRAVGPHERPEIGEQHHSRDDLNQKKQCRERPPVSVRRQEPDDDVTEDERDTGGEDRQGEAQPKVLKFVSIA